MHSSQGWGGGCLPLGAEYVHPPEQKSQNTCKNITFPQLFFADGSNQRTLYVNWLLNVQLKVAITD